VQVDKMALTLGLVCFSVAIIVPILAIIYARKAALRAKYRPNKNTVSSNERVDNRHPRYKKLVGLLHGDREAADRLGDTFGVDRAIQDLIRDRMR